MINEICNIIIDNLSTIILIIISHIFTHIGKKIYFKYIALNSDKFYCLELIYKNRQKSLEIINDHKIIIGNEETTKPQRIKTINELIKFGYLDKCIGSVGGKNYRINEKGIRKYNEIVIYKDCVESKNF